MIRFGLLMSQMVKYYQGGITFDEMLKMPYKRFMMLYEYMIWQLREQTEEGQKTNRKIERTDVAREFGALAAKKQDGVSLQASFDKLKRTLK